jgi:hypothetical protein
LLGGEMTAVGLGGWGLFHDGFLRCRILYQPAPVFPISSEALHSGKSMLLLIAGLLACRGSLDRGNGQASVRSLCPRLELFTTNF